MTSDQDPADAGGSRDDDTQTARERLVARAAALRAALEERRVGSLSIDAAFRALDVESETGGGVLAGAIAFRVFMFILQVWWIDRGRRPESEIAAMPGFRRGTDQS